MILPPVEEALVAPVVRDSGSGEILPQEPVPTAPALFRPAPAARAKAGDLICGDCGEGNVASRRFCHRCGHSLREAEVARGPWYRRLVPRRGPRVLPAGRRPGHPAHGRVRRSVRTSVKVVRRSVWVVVLVAGLLVGLYPPLRTMVLDRIGAVKQDVAQAVDQTLAPVRPVSVKASAEVAGHPANAAFDAFGNTCWAAPWARDREPSLTVDLGKPVTLVKLLVTSGAGKEFTTTNRPSIVNVAYSNEKSDTVTLRDTPEPQQLVLPHALGARTIRIQVLDVYGADKSDTVAVTEIELFAAL